MDIENQLTKIDAQEYYSQDEAAVIVNKNLTPTSVSSKAVLSEAEQLSTERSSLQDEEVALTLKRFKESGFLSGEKWDRILTIHARILDISDFEVICECIIDREESIFEIKSFPKDLFNQISGLKVLSPILIRIKSKPGSSRIDVYEGNNIVDLDLFEVKDNWDLLRNSGLDQPFKYD